MSLHGTVVDPDRPLAYVAMDRSEDDDLAVFGYSKRGLVHKGTVKGFGDSIFSYGMHVGSIQRDSGLVVWNMTNPLIPRRIAGLSGVWPDWPRPIVDGNTLFQMYRGSIQVFDLGSPEVPAPQKITSFHAGNIDQAVLLSGYLISIGQALGTYTLGVYDVRDIRHIEKTNEVKFDSPDLKNRIGGTGLALLQGGRFLLISNFEKSIHVFDMADPINPVRLPSYVVTGSSWGLCGITRIDDGRFLLAQDRAAVRTYRIDSAGRISPESAVVEVPEAQNVDTSGVFGFVTGWGADLSLLDLSQPSNPEVIASSDPHPYYYELMVDSTDVYVTARDTYRIDSGTGKLLPVPMKFDYLPLAVQNRMLLMWSGGKLSLYRREKDDSLTKEGSLPLGYASAAEFCGPLLRVFSNNEASIYDCAKPEKPVFLGKVDATSEGYRPGCYDRDQALFDHFLAIRDSAGQVKVYDAYHLSKGPILKASGAGNLSRSREMLFFNSPEGLKIIHTVNDSLTATTFPELAPYSTWNISADLRTMAVWYGSEANIYHIERKADGRVSISLTGPDSIPACLCHGGWYGRLAGKFLLTADAFAGISVLRINNPPSSDHLPEIALQQPKGSDLVDGKAKRSFGTVKIGTAAATKTFTIKNKGNANLGGLKLVISGMHKKDFRVVAPTMTNLEPGASTTFTVKFKPTAKGTRSAILQIKSNDANEDPFDINLSGMGASR